MFGTIVTFAQPQDITPPPKDVPPPTPIRLPQCNPQVPDVPEGQHHPSLVRFLQQLQRPNELNESHFAALGVHVHTDSPAGDVVPDSSFLPSRSGWDIDLNEAQRKDENFRRPLSNGKLSPEARVYWERRTELSIPNQLAFRTVRRIKPEPGKQLARLGNCYEFFRQLELMAAFWDDTSLPPPPSGEDQEDTPPLPPRPGQNAEASTTTTGAAPESHTRSTAEADSEGKPTAHEHERVTFRTNAGSGMPAEFRHNAVAAFVKLVAYDFGCNVVPPRVEPRLQLLSPPSSSSKSTPTSTTTSTKSPSSSKSKPPQIASYFPSGCVFLAKAPQTREAARAGLVEGPIAAVSARNTTGFATPAEARVDFGRELVAALITAQNRAREGKPESRFGEGKWWATEKRWGGGEGGPIGREVDGDSVVGDKDASASSTGDSEGSARGSSGSSSSASSGGGQTHVGSSTGRTLPIPMRGQPLNKKPRKNLSIYDNYRMVRLPSTTWDKKMKYVAIGKAKGTDYDDVFVLSSLFHHFCVLRVRVPNRLLDVLAGEPEADAQAEGQGSGRSWGKLEMWRSKWFDLFVVEDRLEAMRLLWGMMAWVMREEESGGGEDVAMKNA
ncbi:hypothetical protein F5Y04DRAFT_255800 [Hypomontagnella monticulosa]|nr:hypothetical protein F5Y04DRAFT_255800 [Hypomontagnella monticulosa]